MTKPTTEVTWATDATYTVDGDAWGGAATKVDPGATRRAEGAEPDTFPAEWYNYMQNSLGAHIVYIEDVLEGSDDIPSTARTLRLGAGHMHLIDHGDETGLEINIPASEGQGDGTATLLFAGSGNLRPEYQFTNNGASDTVFFDIGKRLPAGATVTRVRALVRQGVAQATSTSRMDMIGSRYPLDYATPATGVITTDFTVYNGSALAGLGVIDASGLSITVDPADHFLVAIGGSVGASTVADEVIGVRVTYTGVRKNEDAGFAFGTTGGGEIILRSGGSERQGAVLELNRYLPNGATINDIRVLVQPGAARSGGSRMQVGLYENTTKSWTTPALGTETLIGSTVEDDGTTGVQAIVLSALAQALGSDPTVLVVEGSTGDFTPDSIYGVEVDFTDPGPRNF